MKDFKTNLLLLFLVDSFVDIIDIISIDLLFVFREWFRKWLEERKRNERIYNINTFNKF